MNKEDHFTHSASQLFRAITPVLASLILFGCQIGGVLAPPLTAQTMAENTLLAQQFETNLLWRQAADMYRILAQNSIQPDRSVFYQKSALMIYKGKYYEEIEAFYDSLKEEDLSTEDQTNKQILLAGIYFEKGKTYQSMGNMPELDNITDTTYKALALNIRSKAVLAIGKPLESAKLRIEMGQYLQTEQQILTNHDYIWDALNRITEPRVIKALAQQQTIPLRGWMELNLIARRSNMQPAIIEPWIKKWHELYPQHEASIIFADMLLAESKLIYINPGRIALLLPFADKYKNVAEAIQNGFLYAYYNDPQEKPILEFVNVSSDPHEFYIQYNQAIQNGADFIVGPLDKSLVNDLHLNEALRVPTLTLNYADNESVGIDNMYQFGLRPEDEAEQIADYALINAHYHAVTLTPDSKLGVRMQKAFTDRFESLGGLVVDSALYPSRKNDYSVAIKQLLNINSSNRRHSLLQQITGTNSSFIPRRRQDIDMVFITGNPRQGRLIKPQLKFHHAIDLPVYATSSISSSISDPDADRDLNEVLFVDTPWALDKSQNTDYQGIQKLWPKQSQRYAKFFALGVDAYRLIPSLRRLMINPQEQVSLSTGTISVDKNGRIHRELILATYEKGRARVLKESVESTE